MTGDEANMLAAKIAKLTNHVYDQAVLQVKDWPQSKLHDNEFIDLVRSLRFADRYGIADAESFAELQKLKVEIDDLYLSKMLSLNTQHLNEILIVHDTGRIKRTSRTIEAITSELARRELLDDSSESESKNNYGDVYEHSTQGEINSETLVSARSQCDQD